MRTIELSTVDIAVLLAAFRHKRDAGLLSRDAFDAATEPLLRAQWTLNREGAERGSDA